MNLVKINSSNIWDEEWENGLINSDGSVGSGSRVLSKNYISVQAGETYYFTKRLFIVLYDSAKTTHSSRFDVSSNSEYTIPSGYAYMKFMTELGYGSEPQTYRTDISINYPSSNTTYHPHWVLAQDGQGKAVTADISSMLPSGIGVVDLGSLTWYYMSNIQAFYSDNLKTLIRKALNDAEVSSWLLSVLYSNASVNNITINLMDMRVAISGSGTIYISNHSYTDAASFKTAMSGIMLDYELATPTTESLTPIDPYIEVESEGTIGLTHTESPATASVFDVEYFIKGART